MKECEASRSEIPIEELVGEERRGLQVMKKIKELRKETNRKEKEEAEDNKKRVEVKTDQRLNCNVNVDVDVNGDLNVNNDKFSF